MSDEMQDGILHGKLTKEEAGYESKATGMDDCDDCKSFISGHCKKVEGVISADGWCHLFVQRDDMKAKTKEVL